MNKILSILRKPARLIIMVSICAYALFTLLGAFADFGGNFGSVLGGLLFVLVLLGLVGAFIFAWVKRNDDAMRYIGIAFFAYWGIRAFYRLSIGAYDAGDGVATAYSIFGFLAAICAVGVLGLEIARKFLGSLLAKGVIMIVEVCLVAGFVTFTLVEECCYMGMAGKYEYGWGSFMGAIGSILILPAVLVGFVCLFVPADAIMNDAASDDDAPVEEAPVEEEKVVEPQEEVVIEPENEEVVEPQEEVVVEGENEEAVEPQNEEVVEPQEEVEQPEENLSEIVVEEKPKKSRKSKKL